jgi:DNA polymerase I
MLIELRKGMTLHPGTFTAVIAPVKVIGAALTGSADLQRFLYVSGRYSPLLSCIRESAADVEIHRVFTARQLLALLQEASHTVIFLEHDPAVFDGAEEMIPQVGGILRDISRQSLIVLYAPSVDRSFSLLMRHADQIIEITAANDLAGSTLYRCYHSLRSREITPCSQQMLEVS